MSSSTEPIQDITPSPVTENVQAAIDAAVRASALKVGQVPDAAQTAPQETAKETEQEEKPAVVEDATAPAPASAEAAEGLT